MPLIIVESPTKARTLQGFLGKNYEVLSSYGHIRDLPKNELGIDVTHDFEPKYIIPQKAKPNVKVLEASAKKEKEIILATDADREGEAIAQHIKNVLSENPKPKTQNPKFLRIAFHEITPEAIRDALAHPREIDEGLVNAQKARRVLDRLVGYKLSPLLWRKILRGLSAGRVQSAALRLIVEREQEREAFKSQEYWTIEADFDAKGNVIRALLEEIDGKKLEKLAIKNETEALHIKEDLSKSDFDILDIEKKEWAKHPEPPFITATLQQLAAGRLGFSSSLTMMLAQKLYETGQITYMRTDSTNMAQSALAQAKHFVEKKFGSSYSRPSQWKTKVKLAQEAHEAIRPTSFFTTPEMISSRLEGRELKLYRLIWQRALASQMTPARFEKTRITIGARSKEQGARNYTLVANGSRMLFDGFMKVYPLKIEDKMLPEVKKEDKPILLEIIPSQHFTQPPPRFSEATLVKALKDFGIGRPSTYAPTIEIIKKRQYAEKDENKKFYPTLVGRKVNELLTKHFPNIVDIDFTARMEEDLDEIAAGKKEWVGVVRSFYEPFEKQLSIKQKELTKKDFAQEPTDKLCPQCAAPVVKRLGRFGQFYSCSRYPECKWAQQIKEQKKASFFMGALATPLAISPPGKNQGLPLNQVNQLSYRLGLELYLYSHRL
ncbi:MAG: type I DNA topoisomerase [Candidatus Portnoybacteria bacterium]|nr:type I DNA topoisomerase [Candidatus Portnoybacteria bacterium]